MARSFADAFVLTYRGRDFVRQWAESCDAPASDLSCLRFYWETDWSVVGGQRTSNGAFLYSDRSGRPARYELLSVDSPLRRADFHQDGTRITLRDGATPRPPGAAGARVPEQRRAADDRRAPATAAGHEPPRRVVFPARSAAQPPRVAGRESAASLDVRPRPRLRRRRRVPAPRRDEP